LNWPSLSGDSAYDPRGDSFIMSMHKDFEQFEEVAASERERAFQAAIIIPLLQRLGFSVVWNNHGRAEKGNDVIFAEIDRLGGVVYYGMQVKYIDQLGKAQSQGLIDDVREAFTCPFDEPKRGEKGHISRFYIANAGSISPDVAESVRCGVGNWTPPCNVRFLDGEALATLDKWAAYQRGMFIREQLTGLMLELTANRATLTALVPQVTSDAIAGKVPPVAALRLAAISGYLERPILADRIPVALVVKYWNRVTLLIELQRWVSNPLTEMRASAGLLEKIISQMAESVALIDAIMPPLKAALEELEDFPVSSPPPT